MSTSVWEYFGFSLDDKGDQVMQGRICVHSKLWLVCHHNLHSISIQPTDVWYRHGSKCRQVLQLQSMKDVRLYIYSLGPNVF